MITLLVVGTFFALVSGAIGQRKGKAGVGLLVGFLLGPIGVAWMLLSTETPRCRDCQGVVPAGALKCKHCGSAFAMPIPKPATLPGWARALVWLLAIAATLVIFGYLAVLAS